MTWEDTQSYLETLKERRLDLNPTRRREYRRSRRDSLANLQPQERSQFKSFQPTHSHSVVQMHSLCMRLNYKQGGGFGQGSNGPVIRAALCEMPLNATGRIDRVTLKRIAEEQHQGVGASM